MAAWTHGSMAAWQRTPYLSSYSRSERIGYSERNWSDAMPKITFDLDQDLYDKLSATAAAYHDTPEQALQQILVAPIDREYFLKFTAPPDYFEGRPPVTDEEGAAARTLIVRQIAATTTQLPRPEAVIYGLALAAYDFALKLCEDARYKYPDQHADSLAEEIFGQVRDMLFRAKAKTSAEESERLAQELGIPPTDSNKTD
jgi:hypothetical protein